MDSKAPGVDYDVPSGIPIVPAGSAFLHKIEHSEIGGLVIWLRHVPYAEYRTCYAHLSERFVDTKYYHKNSDVQRLVRQTEIFALSGNSGKGPKEFGGKQPEHLHFGLFEWNYKTKKGNFLDPEKYGIDGGKPIFSDGETNLSIGAEIRLSMLEKVLGGFGNRLQTWQDDELQELKGTLLEYYRLLGNYKGTKILDSKHFHDLRELLKISSGIDSNLKRDSRGQIDRSKWRRKIYGPATTPYSLMLKIVGYSTDEKQKIILMLPFISPELVSKYRKPVYEQGEFLRWRNFEPS